MYLTTYRDRILTAETEEQLNAEIAQLFNIYPGLKEYDFVIYEVTNAKIVTARAVHTMEIKPHVAPKPVDILQRQGLANDYPNKGNVFDSQG